MTQDRRDRCNTIPAVDQDQIHQKPGGSPVAVLEWMNVHQSPVGICGQNDRMQRIFFSVQLLHQRGHLNGDLLCHGRDILCAGDEHLPLPITPGMGRVNAAVEQSVQLKNILLAELQRTASGSLQHIIIRSGVAGGFIAIPDGLAAHRNAIFQKYFCLGQGERISLQGIGSVSCANAKIGV